MKRIILLLVCTIGLSFGAFAATGAPAAKQTGKILTATMATMGIAVAGRKSLTAIEREALQNLDNYEGGSRQYVGINDDYLDFGGRATSFLDQITPDRVLTFKVVNANEAGSESFYLVPGFKNTNLDGSFSAASGVIVTGAFRGIGSATAHLEASSTNFTLEDFHKIIRHNPMIIGGMKVTGSSADVISNLNIVKENQSLFRTMGNETIYSTVFQDEHTFQDKVVTINQGFDANYENGVYMTIAAGGTMTVSLFCGAVLSPSQALQNKQQRFLRSQNR